MSHQRASMLPKIDLPEGWLFRIEGDAIEHQGQAIIDIEVSYDPVAELIGV